MKTAKNPVDGSILNSTQETGYLSPANEKAVAKEKPQFSTEINEPNKTLILAGYPTEIIDQLKEAGVDNFVHVKSNAVEMLSNFQDSLELVK